MTIYATLHKYLTYLEEPTLADAKSLISATIRNTSAGLVKDQRGTSRLGVILNGQYESFLYENSIMIQTEAIMPYPGRDLSIKIIVSLCLAFGPNGSILT
jgi:hypothetical protein